MLKSAAHIQYIFIASCFLQMIMKCAVLLSCIMISDMKMIVNTNISNNNRCLHIFCLGAHLSLQKHSCQQQSICHHGGPQWYAIKIFQHHGTPCSCMYPILSGGVSCSSQMPGCIFLQSQNSCLFLMKCNCTMMTNRTPICWFSSGPLQEMALFYWSAA